MPQNFRQTVESYLLAADRVSRRRMLTKGELKNPLSFSLEDRIYGLLQGSVL